MSRASVRVSAARRRSSHARTTARRPLDSSLVIRSAPTRAVGAIAGALVGSALVVGVSLMATVASPRPASADVVAPEDGPPVVVIGVGGITWADVDAEQTPALASFVSESAVGHLSVRSVYRVTCPVDTWLTIGASRRATTERVPGADVSDNTEDLNAFCPPIPPVEDGEVEGWMQLAEYNSSLSFNATLGLLGSAALENDVSIVGAGPGGGVAAADESGDVTTYLPDPGSVSEQQVEATDLTLVDLGSVDERVDEAPPRVQQVQRLDQDLAHLLEQVPDDATVMLMAGSNSRPTAELQLMAVRGADYPRGWLRSNSTKQDGLVLLTDITPTLFAMTGMAPDPEFVGAPIFSVPTTASWESMRQHLVEQSRKVTVYTEVAQPFFTALVPLQIALYLGAAWAFRRRAETPGARRRILGATAWVAITCSAIPVATFLANLVPWWTWAAPHTWLVALVLVIAVAVAAAARAIGQRHDLLAEVGVVAAVTSGVLALDVAVGGPLQTASLMGYSPVIAGRLYGFGNVAFSLFATGLVFAAAWCGDVLHRRGREAAASWVILAFGAAGVVVDGLPQLGSDFGGMLAFAVGFGIFFLGVRRTRITITRVLAVGGIAVGIVTVVSVLDWLRPPDQRSHLGTFVEQVIGGEFFEVVSRKLANNLDILFSSVLGLLVPFAILFLAFVLLRPLRQTPAVLTIAYQEAPMLRPAFMGWITLMGVGFAVNDSGVAIPAVGIMMTIPFLIVISVKVLARQRDATLSDSPH